MYKCFDNSADALIAPPSAKADAPAAPQNDYMTVLVGVSAGGNFLPWAKAYTHDGKAWTASTDTPAKPMHYQGAAIEVGCLRDAVATVRGMVNGTLDRLGWHDLRASDPATHFAYSRSAMLANGRLTDDAKATLEAHGSIRRLSRSQPDTPATFTDAATHLHWLDIDDAPLPAGMDVVKDWERAADWVRAQLPAAFHDVEMVCWATGSNGMRSSNRVRLRLGFWLAAPMTQRAMSHYVKQVLKPHFEGVPEWTGHKVIDDSVHRASGVILTAPPILEGAPDPFAGRRFLILQGDNDEVDLGDVGIAATEHATIEAGIFDAMTTHEPFDPSKMVKRPANYFRTAVSRMAEKLASEKENRSKALYDAGRGAGSLLRGAIYDVDLNTLADDARAVLADAAVTAITGHAGWTWERARKDFERGWRDGVAKPRLVKDRDLKGFDPSEWLAKMPSQSGEAPWRDAPESVSSDAPRWPMPEPPPLPSLADLRQKLADDVLAFIDQCRDWTKGIHLEVLKQLDREQAGLPSLPPRQFRWIFKHQVGTGKTHAIANALAARHHLLDTHNIAVVVQNHANAADLAKLLEARMVPHRVLVGIDRACSEPTRKAKIKGLSSRGLPATTICDGRKGVFDRCPLRDTCAYYAQKTPSQGEVVILQVAHLKAGKIEQLEQGALPLLCTLVDESILFPMMTQTSITLGDLDNEIKLPRPKKASDKAMKGIADSESAINALRAGICNAIRGVAIPRRQREDGSHEPVAHGLLDRKPLAVWDAFARSLDIDFGGHRVRSDTALEDAADMIGHRARGIAGRLVELGLQQIASSGAVRSIRGRNAYLLRRLEALAQICLAISECADAKADKLPILLVDVHGKRGFTRTIYPYTLASVPHAVRRAPIAFFDATADDALAKAVVRDVGQVEWTSLGGKASRPHATVTKYIRGPFTIGQIARQHVPKKEKTLKRTIVSGGKQTVDGDIVERESKPLDFAGVRSDSHRAGIERSLMALVGEHRRSNPTAKVAVITWKSVAAGLKQRAWTRDITFAHFGAVAGSNAMRDCSLLIVLGQQRPPLPELEASATAIARALGTDVKVTGRYDVSDVTWPGVPLMGSVVGHADKLVDRVLAQVADAQAEQSYGRARASSRDAASPVKIVIMDQIAPISSITTHYPDELVVWDAPAAHEVFEAVHGRLPQSGAEASDVMPEVFGGRKRAQKLLQSVRIGAEPLIENNPLSLPYSISGSAPIRTIEAHTHHSEPETPVIPAPQAAPSDGTAHRASGDPRSAFYAVPWQTAVDELNAAGGKATAFVNRLAAVGHVVTRQSAMRWIADLAKHQVRPDAKAASESATEADCGRESP